MDEEVARSLLEARASAEPILLPVIDALVADDDAEGAWAALIDEVLGEA